MIDEYNEVGADFAWEVSDPKTLFFALMLTIFCVSFTVTVCLQVHMRYGLYGTLDWEGMALYVAVFLICCVRVCDKSHLAFMYGVEPVKAWGRDPSGSTVTTFLCLAFLSTLTCLSIPIRSYRSWRVQSIFRCLPSEWPEHTVICRGATK